LCKNQQVTIPFDIFASFGQLAIWIFCGNICRFNGIAELKGYCKTIFKPPLFSSLILIFILGGGAFVSSLLANQKSMV